MKVLSLNDFSFNGGAAKACNRTCDSLKACGHEVISVSCDGSPNNDHKVLFLGRKYQIVSGLLGMIFKQNMLKSLREKELINQFTALLDEIRQSIVNIHNLHSAELPISLIQTALEFYPVVWTLHDCWSFSANYYPAYCPSPDRSQKRKISDFWQTIKQQGNNQRLSAITPSKWLQEQALASKWEGRKVESIHNPIPDFFFEQQDRTACKRALGLSDDKTTILCIAGNLSEERKGGPILKQILRSSQIENVQFLLVGQNTHDIVDSFGVKHLGFISDDITLRIAYHAADLLLHPAPVDNLPNTVAESMSCGTPVLAFSTGGLPEMVKPEKSGWLVDTIDAKAMIAKLDAILVSRSCYSLRESTKSHAKSLFDSASVGKNYFEHFHSMVENT